MPCGDLIATLIKLQSQDGRPKLRSADRCVDAARQWNPHIIALKIQALRRTLHQELRERRRRDLELRVLYTEGNRGVIMVELVPSILSADFSKLALEIEAAERGGGSVIHIDIMDGHFVPNLTMGPPVVKSLRKVTSLPLDCHLMIENPDDFIEEFAAGRR